MNAKVEFLYAFRAVSGVHGRTFRAAVNKWEAFSLGKRRGPDHHISVTEPTRRSFLRHRLAELEHGVSKGLKSPEAVYGRGRQAGVGKEGISNGPLNCAPEGLAGA